MDEEVKFGIPKILSIQPPQNIETTLPFVHAMFFLT